jgi:hypothetical protein
VKYNNIILYISLKFNYNEKMKCNNIILLIVIKKIRYISYFKKIDEFFSFEGLLVFLKQNLEFCFWIAP